MAAFPLLEQWMRSGPVSVETGLAATLAPRDRDREKYPALIAALQQQRPGSRDETGLNFVLGYFHQEAGKGSADADTRKQYYEAALEYYRQYLDRGRRRDPDTRYFAQWQTGMIRQSLGNPWPSIETSLLQALEYDPARAEALKAIVAARYNQQEWRIAYIYSSYCVEQFLGRRPENRYWGVEDDLYQWKVLRYHIPILLKLRKKEEASAALGQLKRRVAAFSASLGERDRENIAYLIQKTEEEA